MKLLIDNALSPQMALTLRENGYDAIHVRDIDLHAVPDELVFAEAERSERVILSADTDFGALLALRESTSPSFILFRKTTGVRPSVIASQLLDLLPRYQQEIESGCILTVTNDLVRIRKLPIL
jgi:predicted nuclease of predicted toxin-antitoxin system